MNKDFQKILILGMISIAISGVALYSLKDIKFKNTKKIAEESSKQQEIIKEYEELFSEPNEIQIPENQKDLNTTGDLKIILPKFLFNSGFEIVANNLEQKEIFVSFEYVDNFSNYKKNLGSGIENADIYLLPSNRTKGFDLETISIGENPKVYFNSVFNNILSVNDNKFIPYAIDPIVIIKKTSINAGQNRENLFNYVTIRNKVKTNSMPLIWGIGKNDIRLIERLNSPFENYFDILYLHLKQIKENKNLSELKNMLDTEKISLEYKYSFVKLKQLYETIQKRDENCKTFPAICLLSYNFGDIKFGFISDLDILNTYFSTNTNQFTLGNFSNSTNTYPVKGRLFVVGSGNENINLANEFFKEYIRQGIENNTGLRNNTLSAINNIYNIQKTQDKYQEIIKNENNFELIYENINLQEEFIKDTNTIEMLKGNYNAELYLKNIK